MSRASYSASSICIVVCSLLALPLPAAEGWPYLRGADHDSQVRGAGLGERQEFGLERAWQRPLGSGFSAVVVAEGKALTMFSDGDDDVLAAFDTSSGDELWRYRLGERYPAVGSSFDGPLSTPVISGDRVFGLSAWGKIFAVSLAEGRELWARQLEEPAAARRPRFGFSTSPVLAGGVLVVQTGGESQRSITAFDPQTGKLRWALGEDSVQYQSPLPFTLDGREILIAVSDHRVLGLEPETGITLWDHEHGLEGRAAVPTRVGERRLLLNGDRELLALDITGSAGGPYLLAEAWRSRELVRTYALPVVADGVIYGFTGRFLTALDAETGERLWKSRPPGGRGLILVDGRLVTLDSQGELVVGAIDRQGYTELARTAALDSSSYTAPTFAEGLFFVRDLETLAAVRISDQRRTADREQAIAGSLATFVANLGDEGRQEALEQYLEGRATPRVDTDGWVHFLYRGEAEDVALAGQGLVPGESEIGLQRIAGTDVWARSLRPDPSARLRYQFVVDYEERKADPGNPEFVSQDDQRVSELRMPSWQAPEHQRPWSGPRGTLEELSIDSKLYDQPRTVTVYLPAGYGAEEGNAEAKEGDAEDGDAEDGGAEDGGANDESADYPLLIVTYGELAMSTLGLPSALDQLIGNQHVEPLIAVLIEPIDRAEYRQQTDQHLKFLVDDLLPTLEQRFRLRSEPRQRGVFGVSYGGYAALHAALHAPETFGRAAAQSFFAGADQIAALAAKAEQMWPDSPPADGDEPAAASKPEAEATAAERPLLYLDWTRWERAERGPAMAQAFDAAAMDYLGGEMEGTSEGFSWAERLDRPLASLFPASVRQTAPGLNDSWQSPETAPLVERLERDGREIFAHRQLLATVVGPLPGQVIADIGAGSGFMALEFAKLVGDSGRSIAVDINPTMMAELAERAATDGIANLHTRVCRQDSAGLDAGSVDLVFLADTYHHFEYPTLSLASIRRALRPGGQVVLVDFERIPGQSEEWILNHVRAGKEQVIRELESAGFELLGEHPLPQLVDNYVLRFLRP